MNSRWIIATVALLLAAPGSAEPSKSTAAEHQSQATPPPVVVATAEQAIGIKDPSTAPDNQPAKRPRAARVTSCRCGDESTQEQVDR